MTDDIRKLLTEWGGGCWHEWRSKGVTYLGTSLGDCRCGKFSDVTEAEWRAIHKKNRTFDTDWNDMKWLKEKLVEKGMWKNFRYFAYMRWPQTDFPQLLSDVDFEEWLFTMPRFAELVAEVIKEGVVK